MAGLTGAGVAWWLRSPGGLSTSPAAETEAAIVGKWETEYEVWEFQSGGKCRHTIRGGGRELHADGTYRFVDADLMNVEMNQSSRLCEVFAAPAELALFFHSPDTSLADVGDKLVSSSRLRRVGKSGKLADAEALGGGAAQLRKSLTAAKWLRHSHAWHFTNDNHLLRGFHPDAWTYQTTSGTEIDAFDAAGKKVAEFEVFVGNAGARLRQWNVDDAGKRTGSKGTFRFTRIGLDYRDDDTPPGKPESLIVGNWKTTQDWVGLVTTYQFSKEGDFEANHPNWSRPDKGKYKIRPDGSLELYWLQAHPSHNRVYRIAFGKNRLAMTLTSQNGVPYVDDRVAVYLKQ